MLWGNRLSISVLLVQAIKALRYIMLTLKICMRVNVCIVYMHWGINVYIGTDAYGGQRSMLGVFLDHYPLCV